MSIEVSAKPSPLPPTSAEVAGTTSPSFETDLRRRLSERALGLEGKTEILRSVWESLPSPKPAENSAQILNSLSLSLKNAEYGPIPASVDSLADELIQSLRGNLKNLPLRQLGEIALSCKQLRVGDESFIRQIANAASRPTNQEYEDIHAFARIAHLLALRKTSSSTLLESLTKNLEEDRLALVPRGCSLLLQAVAELDSSRQSLMAGLLSGLLRGGLPDLDDSSMRKIEGVLQKLNFASPEVARVLAGPKAESEARATHRIPEGVLTALNRGGFPFVEEANRRASRMIEQIIRMDPAQCAETARKFIDWGVSSVPALRALGERYEKCHEMQCTNPTDLLSVIKLLSVRAHFHENLFRDAFSAFTHNASTLSCEDAISLLKVVSHRKKDAPELMRELGKVIARDASSLEPELAVNVLKFYADRNVNCTELFSALEKRLSNKLDQVSPTSLAILSWSAAVMARRTEGYTERLSAKTFKALDAMDVHAATTAVWSLAVQDSPEASQAWDKVVARHSKEPWAFDTSTFIQLHQAGIVYDKQYDSALQDRVTQALADRQRQSAGQPLNRFEQSVLNSLTNAGYVASPQHFVAGYQIDFLVEVRGIKYAVECDGSLFHRVGGEDTGSLLGNSSFRDKVLGKLGIRTLRIVDHDWDFLTDVGKVTRLQELLEATPDAESVQNHAAAA
jgi:hypothetical protein